jgi:hypothetical protein
MAIAFRHLTHDLKSRLDLATCLHYQSLTRSRASARAAAPPAPAHQCHSLTRACSLASAHVLLLQRLPSSVHHQHCIVPPPVLTRAAAPTRSASALRAARACSRCRPHAPLARPSRSRSRSLLRCGFACMVCIHALHSTRCPLACPSAAHPAAAASRPLQPRAAALRTRCASRSAAYAPSRGAAPVVAGPAEHRLPVREEAPGRRRLELLGAAQLLLRPDLQPPGAEQREGGRKEALGCCCRRWERKKKKGWSPGRRNREEGGMEFPKDLCAKSENYKDLFVKQNFPLI